MALPKILPLSLLSHGRRVAKDQATLAALAGGMHGDVDAWECRTRSSCRVRSLGDRAPASSAADKRSSCARICRRWDGFVALCSSFVVGHFGAEYAGTFTVLSLQSSFNHGNRVQPTCSCLFGFSLASFAIEVNVFCCGLASLSPPLHHPVRQGGCKKTASSGKADDQPVLTLNTCNTPASLLT